MIVTLKQNFRRLFNFASLAVVTPLLIWSIMSFSSSLLAAAPQTALKRWECAGKIDDFESWISYEQSLKTALKLDPGNVEIMRNLAKMHEWRTVNQPAWDVVARIHREHAIDWYKKIVHARPTWAMGWIELANSKIRNMEFDDEAFIALRTAMSIAPWQRDVQNRAIWLTVGIWESAPAELQARVKDSLKRMLHNELPFEQAVLFSMRFRWLDEFKTLLDRPEDFAYIDALVADEERVRHLWSLMASTKPAYCTHLV
jgi:hypothetical protein